MVYVCFCQVLNQNRAISYHLLNYFMYMGNVFARFSKCLLVVCLLTVCEILSVRSRTSMPIFLIESLALNYEVYIAHV